MDEASQRLNGTEASIPAVIGGAFALPLRAAAHRLPAAVPTND